MDSLGVICARAGSVRVPNKALQIVGGMTLLEHAEQAAKQSRRLTGWLIASDIPPGLLSSAIANGPLIGTVQWALEKASYIYSQYDVVVTLQACIPFRTGLHIDRTIEILERCDLESAQTVINIGWGHAPIYKPNGAVYATRVELVRQGRLWGAKHGMVLMSPEESINIDTEYDLRVARALCALSS